jgi:hypothetical protein
MKMYFMIFRLLAITFFGLSILNISGCSGERKKININSSKQDSLSSLKLKQDSILIANLKAKKIVSVGDKTIKVLANPVLGNKVSFEYDFSEYGGSRYYPAKRDETILSIRFRLNSKSRWNNSGSNFLPNLNVFELRENNKLQLIGTMTYQSYRADNGNYYCLEQRFDYKESDDFVCWISLKKPLKYKHIISVNSANATFYDLNTVIGIINPDK